MRAMLICLSEIHDKRRAKPRPGRAGSLDKNNAPRKNGDGSEAYVFTSDQDSGLNTSVPSALTTGFENCALRKCPDLM